MKILIWFGYVFTVILLVVAGFTALTLAAKPSNDDWIIDGFFGTLLCVAAGWLVGFAVYSRRKRTKEEST